jgi:hypothetical protein
MISTPIRASDVASESFRRVIATGAAPLVQIQGARPWIVAQDAARDVRRSMKQSPDREEMLRWPT